MQNTYWKRTHINGGADDTRREHKALSSQAGLQLKIPCTRAQPTSEEVYCTMKLNTQQRLRFSPTIRRLRHVRIPETLCLKQPFHQTFVFRRMREQACGCFNLWPPATAFLRKCLKCPMQTHIELPILSLSGARHHAAQAAPRPGASASWASRPILFWLRFSVSCCSCTKPWSPSARPRAPSEPWADGLD